MNFVHFENELKNTKQKILENPKEILHLLEIMVKYDAPNLHISLSILENENKGVLPVLLLDEEEKRYRIVISNVSNFKNEAQPHSYDLEKVVILAEKIEDLNINQFDDIADIIPLSFQETEEMFNVAKRDLESFLRLAQLTTLEMLLSSREDLIEHLGYKPSKMFERHLHKKDYKKYFEYPSCFTNIFSYLQNQVEVFSEEIQTVSLGYEKDLMTEDAFIEDVIENQENESEIEKEENWIDIENDVTLPLVESLGENVYLKFKDKVVLLNEDIFDGQNFALKLSEDKLLF